MLNEAVYQIFTLKSFKNITQYNNNKDLNSCFIIKETAWIFKVFFLINGFSLQVVFYFKK